LQVNYSLFFWLPFYLSHAFDMSASNAAWYSMLFDAGQIVGGFVGGAASDRLDSRAIVVVVMITRE
jgi:OPA family glycerol-3-phosphate transporter-like MFS transporter 3